MSICGDNYNIKNSKCEKLLGIRIDNKLNFNTYVDVICKKAGQKLDTLSRVTPFMDLSKRRILLNAFFHFTIQLLSISLDVSSSLEK